jgi:hypothetical protein
MDQRSIVLYLNRKGLAAQVSHDDFVATLREEAIAYSVVTNYLRAARIIPCDATSFSAAKSPHIDESDETILRALEELPFSSIRQLSRVTHLPKTMVYMRLSQKFGLTAHHLRWFRISCLMMRRQVRSNGPGPFERYSGYSRQSLARSRDPA